ncbi:DUF2891 family protein [Granulicella sp. dw_53]|uniref:DUF2891 family protein n=1 Tax=Granulicella sp. dw_53 TaxID=2719792 RepID=UPI001BD5085A|nr:DUF2891 family protein [Granulicella sp. dw_53]
MTLQLPKIGVACITTLCLLPWGSTLSAQVHTDLSNRMAAYGRTLPHATVPKFGPEEAVALAAWPLSCIDHPQAAPEGAQYLWLYGSRPQLPADYDKTRAFYGCYDWHSAVNSMWMMVALSKDYPNLALASLMREKLIEHLDQKNIAGELEFFKQAKAFEKPYGYAWLLKLDAELKTWNDPDAAKIATNLEPLVQMFSGKLIEYFDHLPYASRAGVHPNTALSMTLVLDYVDTVPDQKLNDAVLRNAKRLFMADRQCPTAFEPGGTEFLSPCLAEAQLMIRILPAAKYSAWIDTFLPQFDSPEFQTLAKAVDVSSITSKEEFAGKSHLIGLAFQRAMAMSKIADALPPADPRVPVLHQLAALNASHGFGALFEAGYLGSHWLGTYAVLYLRAARHAGPQPAGPAKALPPSTHAKPANEDPTQ